MLFRRIAGGIQLTDCLPYKFATPANFAATLSPRNHVRLLTTGIYSNKVRFIYCKL